MPSGSHRSRGGSHFSGGGSSRSSSSFGGRSIRGSSYGSHRGHHSIFISHGRPRRFRFGHHYYIYTGRSQGVLSFSFVLVFILMMVAFISGSFVSSAKYQIKTIETDFVYYQDMIDYAEGKVESGDPRYIVDAEVTGRFYNSQADRYYVEYEIELGNGRTLKGETYACYTLEQAQQYRVGNTIRVALENVPPTLATDSVNVDYKYKTLDDDGEYLSSSKSLRNSRVVLWLSILAIIATIAFTVVYAYKKKELADEEKEKEKKEDVIDSDTRICKYCGSICDKTAKKCPNCGAGLK